MKTAQEIFDFVTSSLLKQGRQSINLDGTCMYRGEYGCKCAAGWLIPDSVYNWRMEGESVWKDSFMNLLDHDTHSLFSENHTLICELQCVHDGVSVEYWPVEFKRLAQRHKLTYNTQTF